MKLTNPSELKNIIGKHGFTFSKSLGQNFLIDDNVLNAILDGSGVNKECGALEIGPGAGVLTRSLAERAKKVVTVEIDKTLMPILNDTLSEFDNTVIINEDILKINLVDLFNEHFKGMEVHVVANLPYYITTPVIMKLLESGVNVSSITVMVQKEVAMRMAALPGGKDYGALSVAVQFYSDTNIITKAEPSCFIPQPKVASSVIKMDITKEPKVKTINTEFYFKVVKSAFGQRRKTLVNALTNSPYLNLKKENILEAIIKAGFNETIRGEKLSIHDFAKLSDLLYEYR